MEKAVSHETLIHIGTETYRFLFCGFKDLLSFQDHETDALGGVDNRGT